MTAPSGTYPTLLDGDTATELRRAGVPIAAPWGACIALLTEQRRQVLRGVHARYLSAGAQILTANRLRCNWRAMREVGLDAAGPTWLVQAAVAVARAACNDVGAPAIIAGSIAPVADCSRPDLVPPDEQLHAEHGWLAAELVRAGADLVLIETMNTTREATIALEEALAVGGRTWVSFVCTDGPRLLSGEPVAVAARAVEAIGAEAVLVNCAGIADTEACIRAVRDVCSCPIGALPNIEGGWGTPLRRAVTPEELAMTMLRWRDEIGLSIFGGCCGTTTAHIGALADALSVRASEVPSAPAGSS